MKQEDEIRLSAWFDGELPASEKPAIEALLAEDPEAKAYLADLQRTREGLRETHRTSANPDPAWQSVEARLDERTDKRLLTFPRLAGALAAVIVLGVSVWIPLQNRETVPEIAPSQLMVDSVELVETDLEDATPIVFIDEPSGWTIVWVLEASDGPEEI